MKKVLITGCNGLLGQKLLHTLTTDVVTLFGCDLMDESVTEDIEHLYYPLDISDRKSTIDRITEIEPDVIVHAGAMTNVDLCETERERCWDVNVNGTEHVILGAEKVGAKTLFLSTDYIFDGEEGPYVEEDRPNPVTYYGRSKLAAENIVRGSKNEWIIIRTIVLYGYSVQGGHSFLTWLIGSLSEGKQVKIVNDQWSNATFVDDLSLGIKSLVDSDITGIFNIGGEEIITRYDFSRRIADYFGLNKSLIIPVATSELNLPADRPLRSGLVTDKARNVLNYEPTELTETFARYELQTKLRN